MAVYVGISEKTGELVAGDMLIELRVREQGFRSSVAIWDYEDFQIHPVPACLKILPDSFPPFF